AAGDGREQDRESGTAPGPVGVTRRGSGTRVRCRRHGIYADRLANVAKLAHPEIAERDVAEAVADGPMDVLGHGDATRFGEGLQACSDVDRVAHGPECGVPPPTQVHAHPDDRPLRSACRGAGEVALDL